MRTTLRILTLLLILPAVLAAPGLAHEGHHHEARGTIKAVTADGVTLSADGKDQLFVRTTATKCTRAAKPSECSTLSVSERAIVMYEEKGDKKIAVEIELGAKP